jgi:hypothetical protein
VKTFLIITMLVGTAEDHRFRPDGAPSGVAFRLRAKINERYLSVNWLEYAHSGTRADQLAEVRKAFAAKEFNVAATAIFAVLNVGETARHVRETPGSKWDICAAHRPDPPDISHAGVFGYTYTEEDDLIADLIAEKVIETHPAKG